MNAAPFDPVRADAWRHWNDRHLAAIIAGWRLRLAARVRPGAEITDDLATEAARAAEAEAALAERGQLPALAAAAERLGLNPFEAEVIALALAAEADADCAALLPRGGATPGLAMALTGGAEPSRLLAFAPAAPLVALRVVELDAAAPLAAAPMRLAPRVRDFLLGLDRLDEAAAFLKPMPALDLPRPFAGLAARAAAALVAGARLVALVGAPIPGAAVAAMAAREAGLTPVRFDPSALPADPAPALLLATREAALSRLALVLDLPALPGAVAETVLARPPAPILLAAPDSTALTADAVAIPVPADGTASSAAIWRAAAPRLRAGEARRLARQFDLPAETVARIAPGGDATTIWARARAAAAPALRDLGERITPRATWDDLVLPAETLAALREVAAAAATREIVESRWRLASPGARGQGLAVLLAGPSGTGKTLAAEVLAGALGLDLFRIDLAGVVSKWIGETEKNLAKVFDAAAAGGAVLFFDEADALFGKRSEVNDSHDRYANVEVAYLLQRMEAHRGVSILATNLRANLDQAFLRRLRFAVDLPFPDEAARRAIWARHLPRTAPLAEDLDLDALARLDLPGGAIRNVALNGASLAAAAGQRIGMAHLHAAARREFAKLGRLARGAAR